jgi:predicted AAA+ superfamily ATPase
VVRSKRRYFYDKGIRNALAGNLTPLPTRQDVGALWEGYTITERLKDQSYRGMLSYNYYRRTYDMQEIDWIEDLGGKLYAYPFKGNSKERAKVSAASAKGYLDASYEVIQREKFADWIKKWE